MKRYLLTYKKSRYNGKLIKSRSGLEVKTDGYFDEDNLTLPETGYNLFIDEAQFLTKEQIKKIFLYTHKYEVKVYFWGLRTKFCGELFSGSSYLLAWCEKLVQISNTCRCGEKAIMNKKIDHNSSNIHATYLPTCFNCFFN